MPSQTDVTIGSETKIIWFSKLFTSRHWHIEIKSVNFSSPLCMYICVLFLTQQFQSYLDSSARNLCGPLGNAIINSHLWHRIKMWFGEIWQESARACYRLKCLCQVFVYLEWIFHSSIWFILIDSIERLKQFYGDAIIWRSKMEC